MFQSLVSKNMCSYPQIYSEFVYDVEIDMLLLYFYIYFIFIGEMLINPEINISDTSWCWPGTYEDLLRKDDASVIFGETVFTIIAILIVLLPVVWS